jgi:RHS repeat-associated protein
VEPVQLVHIDDHIVVFLSAGGDPVVMLKRANGTGSFTPYYLHRDSIGSTIAVTNSAGTVLERMAYEPFGKRRAPDGASDPTNAIKGANTDRGFTDHEHLDDLTLIHMNGRVYDPLLGRFLSADPNIQFQDDLQSYNRFSYVSNNPLNTRDPTGYFSLFDGIATTLGAVAGGPVGALAEYELHKATVQYLASHQWAYTIAQIAVAAVTSEYCGGCGSAALSADVTYAQTGSYKASFRAGVITYASSYAYAQAGSSIVENAAVGCATAAASGGKCGRGALAAGFSAGARGIGGGIVVQAVVGGTASVLGGGTFANGAESGAFQYLIYGQPPPYAPNAVDKFALQALGKAWNLPNTALELALGTVDGLIGIARGQVPHFSIGEGAIQISNLPNIIGGGGLTFSDVQLYTGVRPETPITEDNPSRYTGLSGFTYGQHEGGHTIQSDIFGPFFLPIYGISALAHGFYANPLEIQADYHAKYGASAIP